MVLGIILIVVGMGMQSSHNCEDTEDVNWGGLIAVCGFLIILVSSCTGC
jgi:uncharacterized membrane protein